MPTLRNHSSAVILPSLVKILSSFIACTIRRMVLSLRTPMLVSPLFLSPSLFPLLLYYFYLLSCLLSLLLAFPSPLGLCPPTSSLGNAPSKKRSLPQHPQVVERDLSDAMKAMRSVKRHGQKARMDEVKKA